MGGNHQDIWLESIGKLHYFGQETNGFHWVQMLGKSDSIPFCWTGWGVRGLSVGSPARSMVGALAEGRGVRGTLAAHFDSQSFSREGITATRYKMKKKDFFAGSWDFYDGLNSALESSCQWSYLVGN